MTLLAPPILAALEALKGVPQDPEYHPEGDVWTHTQLVVTAADRHCVDRGLSPEHAYHVRWAALLHDIGKAALDGKGEPITRIVNGRIVSPGHDTVGADMAEVLLGGAGIPHVAAIAALIRYHMRHLQPGGGRSMRRLSRHLHEAGTDLADLITLIEADYMGRPPRPMGDPCQALRHAAARYGIPFD